MLTPSTASLLFAFSVIGVTDEPHAFGEEGQAYVSGSTSLRFLGEHASSGSQSADTGEAAITLGIGGLVNDHFALGADLNLDATFGDQLDAISFGIGPVLSAIAPLGAGVNFWPSLSLLLVVLANERANTTINTGLDRFASESGLSIGVGLPVVVELNRSIGLTIGPVFAATIFPAQSNSDTVVAFTYELALGLVAWSAGRGSQTQPASMPSVAPQSAWPSAPVVPPSPLPEVAPAPTEREVASGRAMLTLCDGNDLLLVTHGGAAPTRVSCERMFSVCDAGSQPSCKAFTCSDAATHVYDECQQSFGSGADKMTKNYFHATCEQKRINKRWSDCQVNCLARAKCDLPALQACYSGEACDNTY